MKLIRCLCLTWTFFLSAEGLQCQTCTDIDCNTNLVSCSSCNTMCLSASIIANASGTTTNYIAKLCAPPDVCVSRPMSANIGSASILAFVSCCDTDGCNTRFPPVITQQIDNTLECPSCISNTNTECKDMIQCTEIEDRCVTGQVMDGSTTVNTFGCASANLCNITQMRALSSLSYLFNFTTTPTCSSAWSVRLSVFPVLLGLFTSTFIY